MMRHALAAVAVTLCLALPAAAQKLSLGAVSNYLNGLTTATGTFTQVNADGTLSQGTIYIRRPGRVRFEYAPPDKSLVIAGGGQVAVFDAKSNTPPEQFPLARTPLNLILARTVDLGRSGMVVGHESDGKTTTIVAQDPDQPDIGTIRLVFTDNPIELRQWVITDDTGAQTTVILGSLKKGGNLPATLFDFRMAEEARRRP